jgi:CRP-like cAMP-binding protein
MTMNGEIDVPKGTVLFRQGDASDTMFVVAAGRVRLTLGSGVDEREIGCLGPGDFFGEISLLSGETRSASAQVIDDSRLLVVGRDAFRMLVQDDLETVTRMLSAQGARLSRTNDPIQKGLRRLARVRIIARGLSEVGSAMRLPARIALEALAIVFAVPTDALVAIVAELVERGAGVLTDGSWMIETHDHVDAMLAALVAYAGEPV